MKVTEAIKTYSLSIIYVKAYATSVQFLVCYVAVSSPLTHGKVTY